MVFSWLDSDIENGYKKYSKIQNCNGSNSISEELYISYIGVIALILIHVYMIAANQLIHCGWGKIAVISQTTFSNVFAWVKIYEFRLIFHWSFFLRFKLRVFQHWTIIARRRPGDEPSSEEMMINLLTYIYVTRPQWVKSFSDFFITQNLQHEKWWLHWCLSVMCSICRIFIGLDLSPSVKWILTRCCSDILKPCRAEFVLGANIFLFLLYHNFWTPVSCGWLCKPRLSYTMNTISVNGQSKQVGRLQT